MLQYFTNMLGGWTPFLQLKRIYFIAFLCIFRRNQCLLIWNPYFRVDIGDFPSLIRWNWVMSHVHRDCHVHAGHFGCVRTNYWGTSSTEASSVFQCLALQSLSDLPELHLFSLAQFSVLAVYLWRLFLRYHSLLLMQQIYRGLFQTSMQCILPCNWRLSLMLHWHCLPWCSCNTILTPSFHWQVLPIAL